MGKAAHFRREVSHRVKNNWQVLSSWLSLQAGAIDDVHLGTLVQESPYHISSMALVHEWLQQADHVAQINVAHYAARLIEELAHACALDPRRITLVP
jgi:two-component sensor histidine kinase